MHRITRYILLALVAAFTACALCACTASGPSSSSSPTSDETVPGNEVSREEVEAVLNKAAETTFSTVTFSVKTETTATGPASDGTTQTQTMLTSMNGELDKGGEKPRLHIGYEAQSTMQLGKTSYDMFIDSSNLIVIQNEQPFVDAMTDDMLDSYANSVTSVISKEEIGAMLDMAASYKMEAAEDETTVSITIDKDKLAEATASEDSTLPESTQVATMVVSYSIGSDNRFKTVRLMSSTSGSPTYRVHQSYQFSKYDETTEPEWPDLSAYVAQQSGIMTDANGRMYIVGDDGQVYYVTEIGDDGMIYYDTGAAGESAETIYYETVPQTDTATSTNTNVNTNANTNANTGETDTNTNDGGASTEEGKGRAYITADDGTIHFLDEPGSKLFTNEDGTRYFIDADGNFYFLAEEGE